MLFNNEFKQLSKIKSFYGDIRTHHLSFNYNVDNYLSDFRNNIIHGTLVKVWTGR